MGAAIGLRNRARTGQATTSGGSWSSALPSSNLLTDDMSEVARTADALLANTYVDFDFGRLVTIRALGLRNHNLDRDGALRVQLGNTSGSGAVWDSSYQAAWSLSFTDDAIEWESDNWWQLPADEYQGHPFTAFVLAPQAYQCRYLRLTLNNPTNAAGYLQAGGVWAGDLWLPEYGMVYGVEHEWKDNSAKERNAWNGLAKDKRRRYRASRFQFPKLTEAERDAVLEMARRAGTVEEVLYVPDIADYPKTQRLGFVGTFTGPPKVQHTSYKLHATSMEIEEST